MYLVSDVRDSHLLHVPFAQAQRPLGMLFVFDANTEQNTPLKLVDYPYPDFHPHGLSVLRSSEDGHVLLYTVNHGRMGETVSVFDVDKSKHTATHIRSVQHSLFRGAINDVAATATGFYVSLWLYYTEDHNAALSMVELLIGMPWTYVLFCEFANGDIIAGDVHCDIVAKDLVGANGLALDTQRSKVRDCPMIIRKCKYVP